MKARSAVSISAALLVAAVFASYGIAGEKTEGKAAASIGQQAPEFELKDQNGQPVRLSQYSDKVVVLEWFNNECPFVVKQYAQGDMNKLADKYKGQGVVWLAIDSTNSHDAAHNKKVAGEWSINRPILNDADGSVGHQYGAKTTPHMYVINKGTLVYKGAIDSIRSTEQSDIAKADNYVSKALDEVLAGKPVTQAETQSYGCSVKYK
jgi:peroxiredoxin